MGLGGGTEGHSGEGRRPLPSDGAEEQSPGLGMCGHGMEPPGLPRRKPASTAGPGRTPLTSDRDPGSGVALVEPHALVSQAAPPEPCLPLRNRTGIQVP